MTRLLIRAAVVAAVAAVGLTQLRGEQQLLVWEMVLLGVLIWETKRLPTGAVLEDPPLFDFSATETARLPREVSTVELMVIDALSGHLGPDRRLQPMLRRIASHRLEKRGVALDSAAAADVLGEEVWLWLSTPAAAAPAVGELESVVSKMEEL